MRGFFIDPDAIDGDGYATITDIHGDAHTVQPSRMYETADDFIGVEILPTLGAFAGDFDADAIFEDIACGITLPGGRYVFVPRDLDEDALSATYAAHTIR